MKKTLLLFTFVVSILYAKPQAVFVDFSILGAVISPTKINGTTWDKSLQVNKSLGSIGSAISDMVMPGSGVAVNVVMNSISKGATQGQAAPDIIGYVTQLGYSEGNFTKAINMPVGLANKKKKSQDSYTPDFNTSYLGWPIYENTRFRIKLYDADLWRNDPVGTVEIDTKDIAYAVKENKPVWINVSQQSTNQLLFVQISASRVIGKPKPSLKGVEWKQ